MTTRKERYKRRSEINQEEPKRIKVHAQRKFAQNYSPPLMPFFKPAIVPPPKECTVDKEWIKTVPFSAKKSATDFLTYVCFRNIPSFPSKADLFGDDIPFHELSNSKEEARQAVRTLTVVNQAPKHFLQDGTDQMQLAPDFIPFGVRKRAIIVPVKAPIRSNRHKKSVNRIVRSSGGIENRKPIKCRLKVDKKRILVRRKVNLAQQMSLRSRAVPLATSLPSKTQKKNEIKESSTVKNSLAQMRLRGKFMSTRSNKNKLMPHISLKHISKKKIVKCNSPTETQDDGTSSPATRSGIRTRTTHLARSIRNNSINAEDKAQIKTPKESVSSPLESEYSSDDEKPLKKTFSINLNTVKRQSTRNTDKKPKEDENIQIGRPPRKTKKAAALYMELLEESTDENADDWKIKPSKSKSSIKKSNIMPIHKVERSIDSKYKDMLRSKPNIPILHNKRKIISNNNASQNNIRNLRLRRNALRKDVKNTRHHTKITKSPPTSFTKLKYLSQRSRRDKRIFNNKSLDSKKVVERKKSNETTVNEKIGNQSSTSTEYFTASTKKDEPSVFQLIQAPDDAKKFSKLRQIEKWLSDSHLSCNEPLTSSDSTSWSENMEGKSSYDSKKLVEGFSNITLDTSQDEEQEERTEQRPKNKDKSSRSFFTSAFFHCDENNDKSFKKNEDITINVFSNKVKMLDSVKNKSLFCKGNDAKYPQMTEASVLCIDIGFQMKNKSDDFNIAKPSESDVKLTRVSRSNSTLRLTESNGNVSQLVDKGNSQKDEIAEERKITGVKKVTKEPELINQQNDHNNASTDEPIKFCDASNKPRHEEHNLSDEESRVLKNSIGLKQRLKKEVPKSKLKSKANTRFRSKQLNHNLKVCSKVPVVNLSPLKSKDGKFVIKTPSINVLNFDTVDGEKQNFGDEKKVAIEESKEQCDESTQLNGNVELFDNLRLSSEENPLVALPASIADIYESLAPEPTNNSSNHETKASMKLTEDAPARFKSFSEEAIQSKSYLNKPNKQPIYKQNLEGDIIPNQENVYDFENEIDISLPSKFNDDFLVNCMLPLFGSDKKQDMLQSSNLFNSSNADVLIDSVSSMSIDNYQSCMAEILDDSSADNTTLINLTKPEIKEKSPAPESNSSKMQQVDSLLPVEISQNSNSSDSESLQKLSAVEVEKVNDHENELFLIPLSTSKKNANMERLIQGVAVKVGGDGPNQKVIMRAKLIKRTTLQTVDSEQSKSSQTPESSVGELDTVAEASEQPPVIAPISDSHGNIDTVIAVSEQPTGSQKQWRRMKRARNEPEIQPSNNTAFPQRDDPAQVVETPEFHPTEREFQDPMEFIERITPVAARYGLCKIIPPLSFKPECKISEDMRFTANNQYLHRMLHRWGPSVREMCAIKKYLATQSVSFKQPALIGGIEIDLPKLYRVVQNLGGLKEVIEKKKWPRVAEDMKLPHSRHTITRLDDIYCKYILPYHTLSPEERQKIFDKVDKQWKKREMLKTKTASGSSSDSEEDDALDEVEECVTKGKSMPLKNFYRIARNAMNMWFPLEGAASSNLQAEISQPTADEVESQFWHYVTTGENHICVNSGSIDSFMWGYGFPSVKTKTSPMSRHPWNLKVLTNNNGSVLRSMGPVMGVTNPTLHVGMIFSACCWYRDPHGLPWIEYLHSGAPKIWYGIPDSQSEKLRHALSEIVPGYCQDKKIWLPSDMTMVPPSLLTEHNVSLCRTVQKPGEFILVFPKAFISSICTGYLVSESVYYGTFNWLKTAHMDFKDITESREPMAFSFERLILSLATSSKTQPPVLRYIYPFLEKIITKEKGNRSKLNSLGAQVIKQDFLLANKKKLGQVPEENRECDSCRLCLYLSMVIGILEYGAALCLKHAIEHMQSDTPKNIPNVYCAFGDEELDGILLNLKVKIEAMKIRKS